MSRNQQEEVEVTQRKFTAICVLEPGQEKPISEDKMSWTDRLEDLWEGETEVGELGGTHSPGTHKEPGSPVRVNRSGWSEAGWRAAGRETRSTPVLYSVLITYLPFPYRRVDLCNQQQYWGLS